MSCPKKGRARRAKAKASKVTTYNLRPEFAHLAIEGGVPFFLINDFKPQTTEEMKAIVLKWKHPPMFHGVIFNYRDKP